jgi:3-isopropylmalate dehydratase small subunit
MEIRRPTGNQPIPFTTDPASRDKLLQGQDEIGETMAKGASIDTFEARQRQDFPWLQRGSAAAAA